MRKFIVYATGIILGLLMYLAILNSSLITARLNINNHYLSSFQNQFYFDNGKEIWVEKFRWFK